MVKKTPGVMEEFQGKFLNAFSYAQVLKKYPEGKGDVKDLVSMTVSELKEQGVDEGDLEDLTQEMGRRYTQGDRSFFTEVIGKRVEKENEDYVKFADVNVKKIIDESSDEILRKAFLPYVVENHDMEYVKYKDLERLVSETSEMGKTLQSLQNPETKDEALGKLTSAQEDYYKEKYSENPELVEYLQGLVSPELALGKYRAEYAVKNEELEKCLDKDLRGFIKAAKLSGEEVISIYNPIFEKMVEESMRQRSG